MESKSIKQKITANSRKTKLPQGCENLAIRDTDLTGFSLRIRATASTYIYNGRVKGSDIRRQIVIGDATSMTATQAREAAMALRNQLRAGIDPLAKPDTNPTLLDVWNEYFPKWSAGKLSRQKKAPRPTSIAGHKDDAQRALKAFGDTEVSKITMGAVRGFLSNLEEEDISNAVQRRAFGALSSILQYAVTKGYADDNHCKSLDAPAASEARDRYLTADELAAVWDACASLHRYGQLIRFLIAVPVRLNIARELTWDAVDLEAGTITVAADAKGNKAGVEVTLPLTSTAIEILERQPTRKGLVFRGRNGGIVAAGSTAKNLLDDRSGVTGWRVHDLRRTVVTLTAEAHEDIDESAADLWLMHKRQGVAGIYQKAGRVKAMQRVARQWDSTLRQALDLPMQDNVVSLGVA